MMDIAKFDLRTPLSIFPAVSKEALGGPKMEELEAAFRPLSQGKEEFSIKHLIILKDEERKYWSFLDWWKMPELCERDISGVKLLFHLPRPKREELINGLFNLLKNIEIVSCILRFVDPISFGIYSAPVENLLNVKGITPTEKYLNYLDNLAVLRIEYQLKRNADVDMALWTLARILNSSSLKNSNTKYKDIYDLYYKKVNAVKKIAARNALEQIYGEKDYLNIAGLFIETDHALAAIIAGREIEIHLKKMCKAENIDLMKPDKNGRLRFKYVSEMAQDLLSVTGKEAKENICRWYNVRSDFVHNKLQHDKREVSDMISGFIELKKRFPSHKA